MYKSVPSNHCQTFISDASLSVHISEGPEIHQEASVDELHRSIGQESAFQLFNAEFLVIWSEERMAVVWFCLQD